MFIVTNASKYVNTPCLKKSFLKKTVYTQNTGIYFNICTSPHRHEPHGQPISFFSIKSRRMIWAGHVARMGE